MPNGAGREQVLAALSLEDPFVGFPVQEHPVDMRGWNSRHRYLIEAMSVVQGPLVVEVGVWKGGSTITMAQALKVLGHGGVVISIDTFLGSAEHVLMPEWRPSLRRRHGWPQLYGTFLSNCVSAQVCDVVVPLPLDSLNARQVLARVGIRPDVVHLDAGHDHRSVSGDLDAWYELLAPAGVMICDDYPEFAGVRLAVDEFRQRTPVDGFEADAGKCRFAKPPVS